MSAVRLDCEDCSAGGVVDDKTTAAFLAQGHRERNDHDVEMEVAEE